MKSLAFELEAKKGKGVLVRPRVRKGSCREAAPVEQLRGEDVSDTRKQVAIA